MTLRKFYVSKQRKLLDKVFHKVQHLGLFLFFLLMVALNTLALSAIVLNTVALSFLYKKIKFKNLKLTKYHLSHFLSCSLFDNGK